MAKDKTKALSLRDEKLIEAAANGWSGEEMENKFGVPAAQAIVRVRELLRSRDVWTDLEKRSLLLHSAYALKAKIEHGLDTDDSKQVDAYLRILKAVGDMLDRQGAITQADMDKVTDAQAYRLLQLIEAGYGRARKLLEAEYGDHIDLSLLDEAFREGLRLEAANDE